MFYKKKLIYFSDLIYYFDLKCPSSLGRCNYTNLHFDVFCKKDFIYDEDVEKINFSPFLGWGNLQTSIILQYSKLNCFARGHNRRIISSYETINSLKVLIIKYLFLCLSCHSQRVGLQQSKVWADAKSTPSYFLHSTSISIIMWFSDMCWQYWSKIKKTSFAILGAYNMFENKFYQYRPQFCLEIGKNVNEVLTKVVIHLFLLIIRKQQTSE